MATCPLSEVAEGTDCLSKNGVGYRLRQLAAEGTVEVMAGRSLRKYRAVRREGLL